MTADEAAALVAPAVAPAGGRWADLGAGSGTFTGALARLLGPAGEVHAVDRDPAALAALERLARRRSPGDAPIRVFDGDLAAPDALDLPRLDGLLLANALHFVVAAEQPAVVARLAARLLSGGSFVVVEYDGRPPSRWVPYPVSRQALDALAAAAGLTPPIVIGERPSAFGGRMYAAMMRRP